MPESVTNLTALTAGVAEVIRQAAGEVPSVWLTERLELHRRQPDARAWARDFSRVSRRMGRRALRPSSADVSRLQLLGWAWPDASCAVGALARWLLVTLPAETAQRRVWIGAQLNYGDADEQSVLLRSLPFVDHSGELVDLAVEAGRTNALDVFAAIACHNPYAARHYTEAQMNQLVMKAVFLGLSLQDILGLQARKNAELARMARDFAAERRSAGRSIPEDLGVIADAGGL